MALDFDLVLRHIGQCRAWQVRSFLWLWLTSGAGGLAVVVWAFTAFAMPNRCSVPICDAGEEATFNSPAFIGVNKDWLGKCRYLAPPPSVATCQEYSNRLNGSASLKKLEDEGFKQTTCTHQDLVFDTQTAASSSLVREFALTCGNWVELSALGATYMLGMLIGSFVMGLFSDKFGRMKALMLSVFILATSGFIGAFVQDPISFGFLRLLSGVGGIGCFMVTFVLAVEYVGPKFTMLFGIAIEIPFALGELALGLEAYFVRDWRTLQLVAHAPLILFLGLWFVLDESPRWLIASGKEEEAAKVIERAARVNQRSVPEEVLLGKQKEEEKGRNNEVVKPTLKDLFIPKEMGLRTVNMMYQWFSVTLCYYGLSFAATSLAGDAYSNFCLIIIVEIPSYFFCIFVMDCWGRRPILSFCQVLSGLFCILAALLQEYPSLGILQVIFTLIGKFGASACFAIIYVYTAELFPTIIRNSAIGSCSTIARVGGMLCLVIIQLNNVWGPLPLLIMGCVAVVAGVLAVFFPETVGQPLPETMEDAMSIGKDSQRGLCTCICPKNPGAMFKDNNS